MGQENDRGLRTGAVDVRNKIGKVRGCILKVMDMSLLVEGMSPHCLKDLTGIAHQ